MNYLNVYYLYLVGYLIRLLTSKSQCRHGFGQSHLIVVRWKPRHPGRDHYCHVTVLSLVDFVELLWKIVSTTLITIKIIYLVISLIISCDFCIDYITLAIPLSTINFPFKYKLAYVIIKYNIIVSDDRQGMQMKYNKEKKKESSWVRACIVPLLHIC